MSQVRESREELRVWIEWAGDMRIEIEYDEEEDDLGPDMDRMPGRLVALTELGAALFTDSDVSLEGSIVIRSADSFIPLREVWARVLTEDSPYFLKFLDPPVDELRAAIKALRRRAQRLLDRPLALLSLGDIDEILLEAVEVCHRDGILALEGMIGTAEDEFISRGVRMVVEGLEPEPVREILENWAESLLQEQRKKYTKLIEGMLAIQDGVSTRNLQRLLSAIF